MEPGNVSSADGITGCQLSINPNHAGQAICHIAGSGLYHLRVIVVNYGHSSTNLGAVEVAVTHPAGSYLAGVCTVFGPAPTVPVGTLQFANLEEACPKTANQPSPYGEVFERWTLRISQPTTLRLFVAITPPLQPSAYGYALEDDVQVDKPGTDPTDFGGGGRLCDVHLFNQNRGSTVCVLPRPGKYIVLANTLSAGTTSFRFTP